MVWKARVGNDTLQLDITEAGVILQLLPDDPPGTTADLSQPQQHRHSGDDGTEDMCIIILKDQDPLQGDFYIFNWVLMVMSGTLALQSWTEAFLVSFFKFLPSSYIHWLTKCTQKISINNCQMNSFCLKVMIFLRKQGFPCSISCLNYRHVSCIWRGN